MSLLSLLSLKTSQAKSFKNIVFKNNASGLFSLFTCFVFSFSPESRLKNASLSSCPDRGTCVPRPKYMRTPTEVHAYLGRGTITFRYFSELYLIFFRAFHDIFQSFSRYFSELYLIFFRAFPDIFCLFKKPLLISFSTPCVS